MYIAISDSSFKMLDGSETQEFLNNLISEGYQLMTESQYNDYLVSQAEMSEEEVLNYLEHKSKEYILFGSNLFNTVKQKIWAVNTHNKSKGIIMTSEQMLNLLGLSDTLEKTLKTGSLDTAKIVLNNLISALPQYSSVGNYALTEINSFMATV